MLFQNIEVMEVGLHISADPVQQSRGSAWRATRTWAGMQSSVKFKCQMSNLLDAAGQPRLGNVFFVFFCLRLLS